MIKCDCEVWVHTENGIHLKCGAGRVAALWHESVQESNSEDFIPRHSRLQTQPCGSLHAPLWVLRARPPRKWVTVNVWETRVALNASCANVAAAQSQNINYSSETKHLKGETDFPFDLLDVFLARLFPPYQLLQQSNCFADDSVLMFR